MSSEQTQRLKYIVGDYLAANIGWIFYLAIRYELIRGSEGLTNINTFAEFLTSTGTTLGIIFFPFLMIFISYLSGYYNTVFFKSRLQEASTTFMSTLFASLLMFFIVLINDSFPERMKNYELILSMWLMLFTSIYTTRLILTGRITARIHSGKLSFNTLIIGNNNKSHQFLDKITKKSKPTGYQIKGIVSLAGETKAKYKDINEYEIEDIERICQEKHIDILIISPYKREKSEVFSLINKLFKLNIPIKITPELYDIITSRIRHANLLTEPLIDIAQSDMPESQKSIKRTADIIFSAIALIMLAPIFCIISLLIKIDSKGNVIYKQERVGRYGKIFKIYKFRTMVTNAEKDNIPQLSSADDSRITKVGKFLRKYRLDETLQFWNVIKGDMSLVGPRPERKYFVDQILNSAPYYTLIYQIRPGITSLGMVKFGYATNINEMIERAKYDIIYIENMSLLIDLKIIIYTIKTVITGKGL